MRGIRPSAHYSDGGALFVRNQEEVGVFFGRSTGASNGKARVSGPGFLVSEQKGEATMLKWLPKVVTFLLTIRVQLTLRKKR